MRSLVTGSRNWRDRAMVFDALAAMITRAGILPPVDGLEDVTLVHGDCPTGADAMADAIGIEWQSRYGLNIERHPADWETYGKRAGFVRNAEMVNLGAGVCLAFIANGSRGASMTADLADRAGVPVFRYLA